MSKVHNLQSLLRSLEDQTEGERVSVRDMLNAVGRRSYGPILLLLGFIAVSPLTIIPGTSWLTALLTLLIAGQILLGRKYPWVPGKVLALDFPRSALLKGIDVAEPYVSKVDWFLKPRLIFLTEPPFAFLVALICVGAALVTFPLGLVPFGPFLPGLTVLLFGLGLTARDGIFLLLAGAGFAGACWMLVQVIPDVVAAIHRLT